MSAVRRCIEHQGNSFHGERICKFPNEIPLCRVSRQPPVQGRIGTKIVHTLMPCRENHILDTYFRHLVSKRMDIEEVGKLVRGFVFHPDGWSQGDCATMSNLRN